MIQIENNAPNILMLMTHLQEMGRLIVPPSTAKELLFTIKVGTFRDSRLSRGDLGNQMFQLTAALAYAWRNNAAVVIEKPTPENGIKLDCFKLENIKIAQNIIPTTHMHEQSFAVTDCREASMFFHSDFRDNDIIKLEGYFQNWRFPQLVNTMVRKCFTFKTSYKDFADNILNKIKIKFPDKKIVAVHYRAFDQNESSGYSPGSEINHPPIPVKYYQKAFNQMDEESNMPPVYLIISNSALAAKKALGVHPRLVYSEDFLESEDNHSRTDNDTLSTLSAPVDLCLMAKCDAHIISNSTFSWWGAWLSGNHDVIAPSRCRWFGEHLGTHNLTDLYHPSWKEIWFEPNIESFITSNNFRK